VIGRGILSLALSAAAVPVAPAAEFDPAHWPAQIGESLSAVLERWGEAATFGADCGSWRGPSVDTAVVWRGRELRVMGLLLGNRIDALRFERTGVRSADLPACQAQLQSFTQEWSQAAGLSAGAANLTYDGPTLRLISPALDDGRPVGTFEADYRASRAECRLALVRTGS
jgi:hypothetical protein